MNIQTDDEVESALKVNEVNALFMETTGSREKIPSHYGEKKRQVWGVISWRDCEYGIDEFRSMIKDEPDSWMKKTMIMELLCQYVYEMEPEISISTLGEG